MEGAGNGPARTKNQGDKMKINCKICLTTVAVIGVSAFSTLAVPITPTDITLTLPLNSSSVLVNDISAKALSSFGPGESPQAELNWLQQDVHWFDLNNSQSLVAPSDQKGTAE